MGEVVIRSSPGDQLDAPTLYGLLRLRAEVFVVEQASPYLDLDGHDLEPTTVHLWAETAETAETPEAAGTADGTVVACVRVVREPDGSHRVGRVVSAKPWRGTGLAAELMRRAVDRFGESPIVLSAQAHLEPRYRTLGFVRTGPLFDEDGIAHVPMRRG